MSRFTVGQSVVHKDDEFGIDLPGTVIEVAEKDWFKVRLNMGGESWVPDSKFEDDSKGKK